MQRSQSLLRSAAAAFDFDVVTDSPVLQSRKPDGQTKAAPAETAKPRDKADSVQS
jgi:hypothetical protein